MDALLNLKNNLIQNFYILGLCPDRFFQVQEDGHGVFLNIFKDLNMEFTPEVISKFPPENGNYNSIKDEMVIAHCFPKGFKILQTKIEKKPCTHFEFHLDNILFNYKDEEKRIYSKIYFTCLEFYESLEVYNHYKKEIITNITKNKNTTIEILKDGINDVVQPSTSTYLKRYYIPKIICFASLMPFSNELYSILNIIYQLYSIKLKDSSILPIEKLIEQIVLQIPIPLTINIQIDVSFKFHGLDLFSKELAKAKTKQKSKSSEALFTPSFSSLRREAMDNTFTTKIIFPLFNVNEAYIKFDNTISMEECFSFFQPDDIIKIFKYIILEVPILFFCSEKNILSAFIENFLGLLSPFNYILPNISILPSKFYGLINSEPKFLFGINEKYSPIFFKKNNIDIDKNIIVVNIDAENRTESKIEEIMKKKADDEKNYLLVNYDYNNIINANNNNNTKNKNENIIIRNDYIIYDKNTIDLINIELPASAKKKLLNKLSSYSSEVKKKAKKGGSEENINNKIQFAFYKFLVNILAGYSDYFLKSSFFYETTKNKNCGDNIRYKGKDSGLLFVRELFNKEEFILKSNKETHPFYYVFFNTQIFCYYLRDRIYFQNKINSLPYYQFDQIVYLKKHTDMRKKTKNLYEDLKKGNFEKPKPDNVLEIVIKTTKNFTPIELKSILDVNNKTDILIKYAQLVEGTDPKTSNVQINYCLFPKLLFDDSFFEMNYENLYFMHEIELPSDKNLMDFKKACSSKVETYEKQRKYMLYPYIVENLPSINKADFAIELFDYVTYDWLVLLCCSLWYCEPIEREIRLNKIIELIDKIFYIEEKTLIFIYINFLKYGNKTQCIKVLEKMSKYIGHSNYLFLSLLCIKLEEEDGKKTGDEIITKFYNNNDNNNNKYILKRRSIILSNENFFQKRCSMPIRDNLRNIEDEKRLKFTMVAQNKKAKKNNQNDITHIERIIFYQIQLCPKCNKSSKFDISDLMGLNLRSVKVNLEYQCKVCKAVKNSIDIKYQILLINKNKEQSFITKIGEFKLLSPHRLYTDLKAGQLSRKDYSLKIDNIYKEKRNELFNYIYYFSRKNLTFDFLLPYKNLNDLDIELIENRLSSIISDINRQRFTTIKNDINSENLIKEMEDEFVPINISDNSNYDKKTFDDLTPCYSTGALDGIYGNENENENNNNANTFCFIAKK